MDQLIIFMGLAAYESGANYAIKTGPLTLHSETALFFVGNLLKDKSVEFTITKESTHPYFTMIECKRINI